MSNAEELESDDRLFLVRLEELLEDGKCEEAASCYESAFKESIVDRSLWDLVPLLSSRLATNKRFRRRDVRLTCESLLCRIAENCNARETLLLLIDQINATDDEAKFRVFSKLLSKTVIRTGLLCLDWCFRSIKNYATRLPKPENKKPDENEIGEEEDPTVERLRIDFESILRFLEPIVEFVACEKPEDTKTRNYLLGLHLVLFDAPFCYLDDASPNTKTLIDAALSSMSKLTKNFLRVHSIVDERSYERRKRIPDRAETNEDDDESETETLRSEISDLAFAHFYYFVSSTEIGMSNTAQIYDALYLSRGSFYLANLMLRAPEYVSVTRGLGLVATTIARIERFTMPREYLETKIYRDIFASLAQVMIYCDVDASRKSALRVFRDYVDRYDYRARYLALLHLCATSNHSGMLSLLIGIAKTSIIRCLDEAPRCDYFLGRNLRRLLKIVCRLSNGSATDLVEISDEVIAALNLLRFLTIRDRDDSTGIWHAIDGLETEYLEPLREGIDLARAHWRVKVKDLEEQRKTAAKEDARTASGDDISVCVGGKELPALPVTEKIKFCHQALNALDVMESILTRVNECVEDKRARVVAEGRED